MRWRYEFKVKVGEANDRAVVRVPQNARWARVQLVNLDGNTTWSTGTATVKWSNIGEGDAQAFATAVTLMQAAPGSDRIPVSAVEMMVVGTATSEAGIVLDGVAVFDDQE